MNKLSLALLQSAFDPAARLTTLSGRVSSLYSFTPRASRYSSFDTSLATARRAHSSVLMDFSFGVSHGAHFSLRMPLNATQQG